MSNRRCYKKGEVVWAKVDDFPWWPAVVSVSKSYRNPHKSAVPVQFICEYPRPKVPLERLAPFGEKLAEHSSGKKNRQLLAAIQAAERILSGKSKYEGTIPLFHVRNRGNGCLGEQRGC